MAQFGLYPTPDYTGRAQQWMGQAGGFAGSMQKKRPQPGKTAGGALSSAASMGMAGATVGSMVAGGAAEAGTGLAAGSSMGGPIGFGIGAVVGLGSYLLS